MGQLRVHLSDIAMLVSDEMLCLMHARQWASCACACTKAKTSSDFAGAAGSGAGAQMTAELGGLDVIVFTLNHKVLKYVAVPLCTGVTSCLSCSGQGVWAGQLASALDERGKTTLPRPKEGVRNSDDARMLNQRDQCDRRHLLQPLLWDLVTMEVAAKMRMLRKRARKEPCLLNFANKSEMTLAWSHQFQALEVFPELQQHHVL
eukprot:913108-Amphidinium_carterae.1